MPEISMEKISDLRHVLVGVKTKLIKHGFIEDAKFIEGSIKMITEIADDDRR